MHVLRVARSARYEIRVRRLRYTRVTMTALTSYCSWTNRSRSFPDHDPSGPSVREQAGHTGSPRF